ncbi:MATE family efflux transporter [Aquamicrobium sp. LC103]|uniref:MATE family efflux transporter n=1 Tax=Aquamicrobium sp. LC103 TaxID=1120658 RepID=UPI0009E36001|nr:MATE family efflux transporter [Aquamicrobium sp. LC103]TKT74283.1 MATE family efflux transporter [Aquamicrobium sp. LC103]
MMLAYVTTPLLGLVDTAVIGQLGDAALIGGLAAGAIVFDVVFATFNFLRSGTTGLVAQAYGRGDRPEEQAVFWRAFVVALLLGCLLILCAPLIAEVGGRFIGGEEAVTAAMATYVLIRLLSAPFALTNYAILGYVLGRGEATLGLALQLVLNVTNIVFSVILGLWLGWGIAGVAWGTVIAEVTAALIGLTILVARFRKLPPLARGALANVQALGAMFALNRDIMIRSFVLLGAFALFARQGAQLGTLTLAANAVLMNFFLLSGYFLDGFATAAEQLAGRALGARHRPAFARAVKLTAWWGFCVAGLVTALFLLFGAGLVAVVTTAEDVRATAAIYLPWAAFTALSGVLAFQMDGVFIGATWSRDMRNMMLLSFAAYIVGLLALGSAFGNHGLWAALHLFLLARGLSLLSVLPRRSRQAFGT